MPESPLPLEYAALSPLGRPMGSLGILALGGIGVVAGGLIGLTTDATNSLLSPAYFIDAMDWLVVDGTFHRAILKQGFLEGLEVGVVLSAIMAATLTLITRGTCTWREGRRCLLEITVMVYVLWYLGGIAGVVYAHFQPIVILISG
ncbi:MAG TPA: hypothetical protein VFE47_00065 [Tepidisphaeraceae bacterium]|jgi:hypothetical protein|nr:hypothetical protein [Tepidisphaeraceae bacterium]